LGARKRTPGGEKEHAGLWKNTKIKVSKLLKTAQDRAISLKEDVQDFI